MKNVLQNLARRAETIGAYSVQSEARGIMYFYRDGEYAICTRYQTLRLTERQAQFVAEELAGILNDIKDLRRAGRRA